MHVLILHGANLGLQEGQITAGHTCGNPDWACVGYFRASLLWDAQRKLTWGPQKAKLCHIYPWGVPCGHVFWFSAHPTNV